MSGPHRCQDRGPDLHPQPAHGCKSSASGTELGWHPVKGYIWSLTFSEVDSGFTEPPELVWLMKILMGISGRLHILKASAVVQITFFSLTPWFLMAGLTLSWNFPVAERLQSCPSLAVVSAGGLWLAGQAAANSCPRVLYFAACFHRHPGWRCYYLLLQTLD